MVRLAPLWLALAVILSLAACSDDDDSFAVRERPTLTYMVSLGGLGDNGYNDMALKGVASFVNRYGHNIILLRPADMDEAQQMYKQWIDDHVTTDSSIIIMAGSEYADMVRQSRPALTGKGSRVVVFEADSTGMPDKVSTLRIRRYGAGWLAGAMSRGADALVLAAMPGVETIETAIAGFRDGHRESNRTLTVTCLADDEHGFSMPDSAYRLVRPMTENLSTIIFPLLGGSAQGVLRAINDNTFSIPLIIGIDTDQSTRCLRVPFSMVVHIDKALYALLDNWGMGRLIPRATILGLADGGVEITVTAAFLRHLTLWEPWYGTDNYFETLRGQLADEAIEKENAYEGL